MRNLNCLVTGASSGIGASIAQELSKTVKHIYILSRNASKLEEINDLEEKKLHLIHSSDTSSSTITHDSH